MYRESKEKRVTVSYLCRRKSRSRLIVNVSNEHMCVCQLLIRVPSFVSIGVLFVLSLLFWAFSLCTAFALFGRTLLIVVLAFEFLLFASADGMIVISVSLAVALLVADDCDTWFGACVRICTSCCCFITIVSSAVMLLTMWVGCDLPLTNFTFTMPSSVNAWAIDLFFLYICACLKICVFLWSNSHQ